MKFYSTGISPHLKRKGTPVDCLEKTGESLVSRGFLVRSLSELDSKISEKIQVDEPKLETPVKAEKKKGNPNWGKKKVK